MLKLSILACFLTLIPLKEGHAADMSSQTPQSSVKSRAEQLEKLLNKEEKLQPKERLPQGLNSPRPLPTPSLSSKTETQKETDIGKVGQQQTPPGRPEFSPSSFPVRQKGEFRPHCQSAPLSGHVRILAIDGGGVRGLIPAVVVAQLEKDLGLSITKIFDIFVGNSAGGMLVLALTKPDASRKTSAFTAAQVVEKVKDMSAKMFGDVQKTTLDKKKATLKKTFNLLTTGAKYDPKVLETLAAELYGNITLSEAVKPVFITTYDLNSETLLVISTPLAKRSKLLDFKMAEIARATSAAPFTFPVCPLEFVNNEQGTGLKMQLIDGGVGSNSPTLNGIINVSKEYCTVPAYEILALGTGTAKTHFEKQDMGKKGSPLLMLKPTIKGFMTAQAQSADETIKEFMNVLNSFSGKENNNYTRLQVNYMAGENKKLDDVREEAPEILTQKAQEIINSTQYKQTVTRLKKQLCDEGVYQKENLHAKMCPVA